MNSYDFTHAPHWYSTQPMVAAIWSEIHFNAIKNQGRAFSFDYLIHKEFASYKYRAGFFSNGWEGVSEGFGGSLYERRNEFEEAYRVLQPYIASYSLQTVNVKDSRTANARPNDRAVSETEYYERISVSSIISQVIYNYYYEEGNEFKNRIFSSQSSLLQQTSIVYSLYTFVKNKPAGSKVEFTLHISDKEMYGWFDTIRFEDCGLVPLKRLSQCYGLFMAILESNYNLFSSHGDVTYSIRPGAYNNGFCVHGKITIEIRKKLNEW